MRTTEGVGIKMEERVGVEWGGQQSKEERKDKEKKRRERMR